ncbi:MBG domain-containing protein [Sphingobacterium faecale]|uniref:Gliding motility-associated C-terminal domain-containing protein n=1 Tax=Sphingobacterium faecale TaxID=2803775 RepID=A0ABS1QYM7_9SPHI|nr:MBG domain-containing protein [Sphingobacterium faecale]MBL1407548.1 gliding motility-associated C-terminal domain-containing protein [Sphingobacterium faecale]
MKKYIYHFLVLLSISVLGLFCGQSAWAQTYDVQNIATGGLYSALTKDADGNIYVLRAVSSNSYELVRYTNGQGQPRVLYSGLSYTAGAFPWGLAVGTDGSIYLSTAHTDNGNKIIRLTSSNGIYTVSDFQSDPSKYYTGLAIDAAGSLLALQYNATDAVYEVVKYTAPHTVGTTVFKGIVSGTGLSYPTALAVSSSGDIYYNEPYCIDENEAAALPYKGGVVKVTAPAFNFGAKTYLSKDKYVSALALDESNNLYSLESAGTPLKYNLVKYTNATGTAGVLRQDLANSSFIYPWGVVFHQDIGYYTTGDDGISGGSVMRIVPAVVNPTEPANEITGPVSVAICANTSTVFSISTTGATAYQWEKSTDAGASYVVISNNANYTGETTSTLAISNTPATYNGEMYRCKVTFGTNGVKASSSATLTVQPALSILSQPVNTSLTTNSSGSIALHAVGVTSYQWQVSNDSGGSYTNLVDGTNYAGTNASSLQLIQAPAAYNNNMYRCVLSDPCGAIVHSAAVKLTVSGAPTITQQPADVTVQSGNTTSFSIGAVAATAYQWEVSVNGGVSYADVNNGASYGGATTKTLTVLAASTSLNGNLYRCTASGSVSPAATSLAAKLTVEGPNITATGPLLPFVTCAGTNSATQSFDVAGALLTAAVHIQAAAGYELSLASSGAFTNSLTLTPTAGAISATPIYVRTTTGAVSSSGTHITLSSTGATDVQLAVSTTIKSAPSITAQPAGSTICAGSNTTFSAAVADATGYQWQVDQGLGYTSIANTGRYSGATTATLTITGAEPGMNGYTYRLVATGDCTPAAVSNGASLTIESAPVITGVTSPTADGSYKVGDVISIQVNFSKAVNVTGTPQLILETGTTDQIVNYSSGSGTSTLTFNYTVQLGDISDRLDYISTGALALNNGAITSLIGCNASLVLPNPGGANSLAANKNIVIDGIPPTVFSITRADGSPTNATTVRFIVTFSESVTGVDVSDFTLSATTGVSGAISSVSGSGNIYTVSVNNLSGDGTLRLDVKNSGTGIEDAAGNAIAGGYTAGEMYVLDYSPPSIPTISLADASDSGIKGDGISNVSTPTFIGVTEANATVTLWDTDGTTVLGTATADGSGSWSITTAALSPGVHIIRVRATDQAGNTGDEATFSYTLDTTAPTGISLSKTTVSVSQATAGSTIATLTSIDATTVTYVLAASNNVTDVDNSKFAITGNLLKAAQNLPKGIYSINVVATDAAGNTAVQAFSIHVSDKPRVTSVKSGMVNGTYKIDDVIYLKVTFDQAVNVDMFGGAPILLLETGTVGRLATYVSGGGSNTLTFKYTVQSGDVSDNLDYQSTNALELDEASTIRNADGEDAILTLPAPGTAGSLGASSNLVIDGVRPTVISVVLSKTVLKIGETAAVTITFSEKVTGVSVANIITSNGTLSSLSTADNIVYTATLTPLVDINSEGNTITIDLAHVKDVAGNSGEGTASSLAYEVRTKKPAAPITPKLYPNDDTGISNSDNITSKTQLNFLVNNPDEVTLNEVWNAYKFFVDGVAHNTTSISSSTNVDYWVTLSPLTEGTHVIKNKFTDKYGNESDFSEEVLVTIDLTAPTGTILINNGNLYTNKREVTLGMTSDELGVRMSFSTDGTTWSDWEAFSASEILTLPAGDGTKKVYLRLQDIAGNISSTYSDEIILDTQAPIVTGVTGGGIYNDDRTIVFNEGDATLNGANIASGATVSAEGNYTLIVTDAAGNSTTVQFEIDKTPPMVPAAFVAIGQNGQISLTWSANTEPDLDKYILYVKPKDGVKIHLADVVKGTEHYTYAGLANGKTYEFYLVAADQVGNLSGEALASAKTMGEQSISFATIPNLTYGQQGIVVTASATSNLPVAFASSDSNIAEVYQDNNDGGKWKINAKKVGNVTIIATQTGNNEYLPALPVKRSFTIVPASLTVTADAKTKVYGDTDPALTYTVKASDLRNGDAVSVVSGRLTREVGESVGSYAITNVDLAADNYSIDYVKSQLSITKAVLTVSADAKTKVYGDTDPALTYTVKASDLHYGDAVSVVTGTLTRAAGENVGSYAITNVDLAADNYSIDYVKSQLSITKAVLTVTADAKTKVYGDTDPALTYTVKASDLHYGDAVSVVTGTLTRAAGENVGSYAINNVNLTASNYNINYKAANLDITKATLSGLKFENKDVVYDGTVKSIVLKGTLPVGVEVVYDNNDKINAGNYQVKAVIAETQNYFGTSFNATLLIRKAKQTIHFTAPEVSGRDAGIVSLDVRSSSGLPVALTVDDPMVATVSGTELHVHRLGTVHITAVQIGNENYEAATPVTVSVRVANDAASPLPIRVHQALSPNGDGLNEFLVIEGIRDYPDNKVTIFDKNGSVLAEIAGYDNRDKVFFGKDHRDGTYFYYIDVKDNGVWKREKGYFVIRR